MKVSKRNFFAVILSCIMLATAFNTVDASTKDAGTNNDAYLMMTQEEKPVFNYITGNPNATVFSAAKYFGINPAEVYKIYKKYDPKISLIEDALDYDIYYQEGVKDIEYVIKHIMPKFNNNKPVQITKDEVKKILYKIGQLTDLYSVKSIINTKEKLTGDEQAIIELFWDKEATDATITKLAQAGTISEWQVMDILCRSSALICSVYDSYIIAQNNQGNPKKKFYSFNGFYKKVKSRYTNNYSKVDDSAIFDFKNKEKTKDQIKHILHNLEANDILQLPEISPYE